MKTKTKNFLGLFFLVSLGLFLSACQKKPSLRELIAAKLCLDVRLNVEERRDRPDLCLEYSGEVKSALDDLRPGALVLFGFNIKDKEQVEKLTSDIFAAADQEKRPRPLIAVDEEGGRVDRFSFGPLLPSAASQSEETAEKSAEIINDLLLSLGFDWNFAPVCDVDSNPKNPVINYRAFSKDPIEAGKLVTAFLKDQRVLTCAKHFPGHGDTGTDSHTSLPRSEKTLDDLRKLELLPFKAAIKAGVPSVMIAHIQFPNIETNTLKNLQGEEIFRPATLSRKIVTDLLRGELGFEGVIVSDDFDMDAIRKTFSLEEAVIEAFAAGVDLVILSKALEKGNPKEKVETLLKAVEKAVEEGRLARSDLEESVLRLQKLREKISPQKANFPEYTRELDLYFSQTLKTHGDLTLLPLPYEKEKVQKIFKDYPRFIRNAEKFYGGEKLKSDGNADIAIITSFLSGKDLQNLKEATKETRAQVKAEKAKGKSVILLSLGCPNEAPFIPEADLIIETRGSLAGLPSMLFDKRAR